MPGSAEKGRQPTLVIGAGLTGASLAYIAARSGAPTVVVSVDRPASQATALAAGVVHGLGPPNEHFPWTRLSPEALRSAADRARRGYELLQEVLLSSPHPVGFTRSPHELWLPVSTERAALEKAAALLPANGWPVRIEERSGDPVLVRRDDAVVNPRRLTFELLRQARARGAVVRLGAAYRGIQGEGPSGLLVRIGDEVGVFSRVVWCGGRPCPEGVANAPARARLVLRQLLSPGRTPLAAILELGDSHLVLAPDPLRPGHAVLVRMAEENPGGGLTWPETPDEWGIFRGQAVQQRLAEVTVCVVERGFQKTGAAIAFGGLAGWGLTSVLGACLEALPAEEWAGRPEP